MIKLIPIVLLFIAFSCLSKKDKLSETIEKQIFVNERNAFLGQMKSNRNAVDEIMTSGADFDESMLTDPSIHSQYLKDTLKSAAILGVYLSDLDYCVNYGRSEPGRDLFNSAIEIGKVLGVDNNVLTFLMTRYNEQISQSDSLMNVLNQLFEQSTDALAESKKERLLGVSIAAYQIETLHICLETIENYPKNVLPQQQLVQALRPLIKMVISQHKSIEITHAFLRTLWDASNPNRTPNFAFYDQEFYELIGIYERLNTDDKIADDRIFEVLNDDIFNELSQKVTSIRNEIIDN